jgi:hypothetical protein
MEDPPLTENIFPAQKAALTLGEEEALRRAEREPLMHTVTPDVGEQAESLRRVAAEEAEELLRSHEEAYRPAARVSPAYQAEGGQLRKQLNGAIVQAEQSAWRVQHKVQEVQALADASNRARRQADEAMRVEEEIRRKVDGLPSRTRAYLHDVRERLGDAKAEVEDALREL